MISLRFEFCVYSCLREFEFGGILTLVFKSFIGNVSQF